MTLNTHGKPRLNMYANMYIWSNRSILGSTQYILTNSTSKLVKDISPQLFLTFYIAKKSWHDKPHKNEVWWKKFQKS